MPNVGYSTFDLSYRKQTMCDFSDLVPVMCDEVVPGDVLTLGGQLLIESSPTVDVVKHNVNADVYYYFVPYRILDDNWEDFIKGGLHGSTIDSAVCPKWHPDTSLLEGTTSKELSRSLWYQLGFPKVDNNLILQIKAIENAKFLPVIYPKLAYNLVYYYYYIQHIFDSPSEAKFKGSGLENNETILKCNWFNDYFTTALPYRQRGNAASVSFNLAGKLTGTFDFTGYDIHGGSEFSVKKLSAGLPDGTIERFRNLGLTHTTALPNPPDVLPVTLDYLTLDDIKGVSAGSFPIDNLRQAILLQQYLELNTRSAEFYVDFIKKNFGVSSGDGRYNMPEFIGSSHSAVFFNEVTNLNGATGSELGRKVAIGRSVDGAYITKFRAPEYGLIMALLTIRPDNAYYGGINRQWLRHTCTDFYVPSFANLPYQEVYSGELLYNGEANTVFGYQGRFDEMRSKQDMVCWPLQKELPHRTYARSFLSTPKLGKEFIKCEVQNNNFSLQNQCQFFVEYYNSIKATRPMPAYSQPLQF